ncbi:hypothetical protein ACFL59_00945, partial [Planctomycetota bacterium]
AGDGAGQAGTGGQAGPGKGSQPGTSSGQRNSKKPLLKNPDGTIDFAAMGMTGKEAGAELLRTEEPEQKAPVEFDLRTGESWIVETYYRQTQAAAGTLWSNPVYWQFRIDREDAFQRIPCLVFVVTMVNGAHHPVADHPPQTFYVSKAGYRLVGADLSFKQAGKNKLSTVAYDAGKADGANAAQGSIVPFDLPRYGAEGVVRRGATLPRLEPVDPSAKARLPQPGQLLGAGGEYLEVEFESPADGTTVRQRWARSDMRWPAESVTEHRRSYRRKRG